MRASLIVAILMMVSACGPSTQETTADNAGGNEVAANVASNTAVVSTEPRIKPETIVTFPKGEAACLAEEDLQAVTLAAMSGEKTKLNSYFVDGSCIMLNPGKKYKVIEAQYNDPDAPDVAILEVVGADIQAAAHGAFVLVPDSSLVHEVSAP